MSSIASASNLAMKPMVAKVSVATPARGPKPNITTNRMAMITSWKVRDTMMIQRQNR